jgi:hypothetical protein
MRDVTALECQQTSVTIRWLLGSCRLDRFPAEGAVSGPGLRFA